MSISMDSSLSADDPPLTVWWADLGCFDLTMGLLGHRKHLVFSVLFGDRFPRLAPNSLTQVILFLHLRLQVLATKPGLNI